MNVLLIHSSGLSGAQWRHVEHLLPGVAFAPDLTGYPKGPAWEDGVGWPGDHQHILDCIDAIEGPICLVGHSYGGAVAIRAALERQGRIQKIVAHDPVLWGVLQADGAGGFGPLRAKLEAERFFDEATGGDAAWMSTFVGFWNGPGSWEAMPERHQQAFLTVGRKVFCEVRDLCFDTVELEGYDGLSMPILLTTGEHSPAPAARVCELLAARSARRELRTLPGGHMAPVTHGKEYAQLVVSFLTGT